MKSVLQDKKECYLCRRFYDRENTRSLHLHHVFPGTSRRKQSEAWGLKIWLCPMHHNASNQGVHFNKENDLLVKQMAQEYFEANLGTREAFRAAFIKSYL